MKILVGVNSPPSSQLTQSALRFVTAALDAGHRIERVFFYHDGVLNGLGTAASTDHTSHPVSRWCSLGEQAGIKLILCVSAAYRRGVLDAEMAAEKGQAANLANGFAIAGLGQWMDAALDADRVIRFGPPA
jgi:tRNA 2-thiouridine synthesizing protein D